MRDYKEQVFSDRREAGRSLAERLDHWRQASDLLVLGLPRGGVPVAAEVARALDAPLDVLVVRKLGVPWHSELAMGAIASGGAEYIDSVMTRRLGISAAQIEQVRRREQAELVKREQRYRQGQPAPELTDRTLIVVDDGLATGATMRAAVQALRRQGAKRIVVAAPVASVEAARMLRNVADEVEILQTPSAFSAVGQWYRDFSATQDEEVQRLLAQAYQHDHP